MTKDTKKTLTMRSLKIFHFVATGAFCAFAWMAWRRENDIVFAPRYNYFTCVVFAILLVFLDRVYNAYAVEFYPAQGVARSLCLSTTLSVAAVYLGVMVAWQKYFSPKCFLILIVCTIPFNYLWAFAANKIYYRLTGHMPAVCICYRRSDLNRLNEINDFHKKYFLTDYMENPRTLEEAIPVINKAQAVFVSGIDPDVRNEIVKYCVEKDISVFVTPRIGDVLMMYSSYMSSFPTPTVYIRPTIYPEYRVIKRVSDIVLSLVGIIVFSPLMLLAVVAIRCYDGGPAVYKQVRLTVGGRKFHMYKFRSMCVSAEADGVARLSTGENDPRITPVGRVLRRTRLDELPQLFNILRGDMSFVGPRPERPEIEELYEAAIPEFKLRLRVKAGLTGYAQVHGKYNTDPHDKLEMDLIYICKMSPLLDLRLILATLGTVFQRDSTRGVDEDSVTALSYLNEKEQK